MQKLHQWFNQKRTPQNMPMPGRGQVANSAGGHVWPLDAWQALDRFLILGTEGGTYYASEQTLTVENAQRVIDLLRADGPRVVARVAEISQAGRAYKNDPALFALALAFAHGDQPTRAAAAAALPRVARTGTHLFTFLAYADALRGWGRGLRRAVAAWYEEMPLADLAYQVTKYVQRNGWSHRDALRLAHPRTTEAARNALFARIVGKGALPEGVETAPWAYLRAVERIADTALPVAEARALIRAHRLPREVVPTERLQEAVVWEALLEQMPMTATIRNLATLTRVGLLAPGSAWVPTVAARITDEAWLRKARIHPIQVLAALTTYAKGQGVRGQNTWTPAQPIVDALDAAFYRTFDTVEPTGKRLLLAIDVSGSMTMGTVNGVPGLTPRVASAALALVTAATEAQATFMGFSTNFVPLPISPRQRLDDVVRIMDGLPFAGTDCALPMVWALKHRVPVDAFVVLTDNETWAGSIHPAQALTEYRNRMGIDARLVVVGMTSTGFSIGDPEDAGTLNVVGFSPDTPRVIADFVRGEL